MRAGKSVGKRPGSSDCGLRVIGKSPKRGTRRWAGNSRTIEKLFWQGAKLGNGATH